MNSPTNSLPPPAGSTSRGLPSPSPATMSKLDIISKKLPTTHSELRGNFYIKRIVPCLLFYHNLLAIYDINTLLRLELANTIQVINSGIIIVCILNDIDSSRNTLYNIFKVLPPIRCLVLIDGALWHIQGSIIKSIFGKSSTIFIETIVVIFGCFTFYWKGILYQ